MKNLIYFISIVCLLSCANQTHEKEHILNVSYEKSGNILDSLETHISIKHLHDKKEKLFLSYDVGIGYGYYTTNNTILAKNKHYSIDSLSFPIQYIGTTPNQHLLKIYISKLFPSGLYTIENADIFYEISKK